MKVIPAPLPLDEKTPRREMRASSLAVQLSWGKKKSAVSRKGGSAFAEK